jgi:hypothetical protein
MTEQAKPIRLELTEEQKRQVREATGKELSAVEFTVEQLEDRVAPKRLGGFARRGP